MMPHENTFLRRYAKAFGGPKAMLLRLVGLSEGEKLASGPWVIDSSGRRWLDFGSFGVHLLGHRHPAILEVAHEQLNWMGLSTRILGSDEGMKCAEVLLESLSGCLDSVIFANSGAEATEIAIKLASYSTGRKYFAALRGCYHGKTLGALSLSQVNAFIGNGSFGSQLASHVRLVEKENLEQVDAVLSSNEIAGFIVEPIQGEGGIRTVSRETLVRFRDLATKTGTILILDEIQTGLGRCGEIWRSAGRHVKPDILLAGKVLGGGILPLAAAIYDQSVIGTRAADPIAHASSFAGGALAARVGRSVVELVRTPKFLSDVRGAGEYVMSRLRAEVGSLVTEIRGEGLMIGLETDSSAMAGELIMAAAQRGLLLTFCLQDPCVVRAYPPAVCSRDDLAMGVDILVDATRFAFKRSRECA